MSDFFFLSSSSMQNNQVSCLHDFWKKRYQNHGHCEAFLALHRCKKTQQIKPKQTNKQLEIKPTMKKKQPTNGYDHFCVSFCEVCSWTQSHTMPRSIPMDRNKFVGSGWTNSPPVTAEPVGRHCPLDCKASQCTPLVIRTGHVFGELLSVFP